IRERGIGLFLRQVSAVDPEPEQDVSHGSYQVALRENIKTYFPIYDDGHTPFRLGYQLRARGGAGCSRASKKELFLFAPGFFRANAKTELNFVFSTFKTHFPCVVPLRADHRQAATIESSADSLIAL